MINILLFHSDEIMVCGLKLFLSDTNNYKIFVVNDYVKCLDSARFLQKLAQPFVIIAEGKVLDVLQCERLVEFNQAKLILCDRLAQQNSLLLALNCNSSYISLEQNEPQTLILAIQCVLAGSIFICPQAKKKLNSCVFQPQLQQRQAIAKLELVDQQILALVSQGHSHYNISKMLNYSALNISYRLKNIIQKLNLQTKQEAILLANSIGLTNDFSSSNLQAV